MRRQSCWSHSAGTRAVKPGRAVAPVKRRDAAVVRKPREARRRSRRDRVRNHGRHARQFLNRHARAMDANGIGLVVVQDAGLGFVIGDDHCVPYHRIIRRMCPGRVLRLQFQVIPPRIGDSHHQLGARTLPERR